MKNYLRVLILCMSFFAFSFQGIAQQKLILLNGKTIETTEVRKADYKIFYRTPKHPEKEKTMSEFRVFSIERGGIEQLVYVEDTIFEGEYTIAEMRMFVKGQQDAREHFKPTFTSIGSAVVGGGAAYFTIYGLVIPALYSQIAGVIDPNMEKQKGVNKEYLNSEEYVEGYMKRARDMKIQRTFMYGYAGFAAGVAGFIIFLAE